MFSWAKLNNQRKGKFAEYYTCMQLTLEGADIYKSEVDDRGIDFVIRLTQNKEVRYFDVQVKSGSPKSYLFVAKSKFQPRENLLLALVVFEKNSKSPAIFLIPSLELITENKLFKSRDYVGKKSKPEWGIVLTDKNIELLERKYSYINTLRKLSPQI